MSFLNLFPAAILVVSLSAHSVSAKEEAAGKAEAEKGKDAKAEEPTTLSPWLETENKVMELNSKIKSKETNLVKLIEQKKALPANSPQIKALMKDIVKEHKELLSLISEYDKKVTLLKYRFPERNSKTKKTYERIEAKSIEDLEQSVGIDGKLNRNLKRMRGQFKPNEQSAEAAPTAPVAPLIPVKKEKSIEDEGSIIIQK